MSENRASMVTLLKHIWTRTVLIPVGSSFSRLSSDSPDKFQDSRLRYVTTFSFRVLRKLCSQQLSQWTLLIAVLK
jgi:hypothetical protein